MSSRISLCQDWQLTDCAPDVAPEKAFSEAFWADSVPCTAPSEVHDVYLKAGRISDPYHRDAVSRELLDGTARFLVSHLFRGAW